jgi:FkbM family methyltransferase
MRHVRNGAVSLDRSIVRWLKKSVKIGDVVYDVNAGFGAYAIIAAKQRGAVVVAFEPGYKMYHALCDNLALNGCHGVVVPVPLAISDRDRVAHLKYHRGFPGEERYVVQPDAWRVRPPEAVRPDIQSVCAASLDAVAGRYGLPPATHLRLSRHVAVGAVLDGATRTIAQPSLRSIWLRIPHDDEAAVVERLGGVGLHVAVRGVGSNGVQLVFTREPAGTATVAGAAT